MLILNLLHSFVFCLTLVFVFRFFFLLPHSGAGGAIIIISAAGHPFAGYPPPSLLIRDLHSRTFQSQRPCVLRVHMARLSPLQLANSLGFVGDPSSSMYPV